MLKSAISEETKGKNNDFTPLSPLTPRHLMLRLTRRFSGRGPRPHQDRGLCAAPPFQPRPLNASVSRHNPSSCTVYRTIL